MKNIRSEVCKKANALVKAGYNKSEAFKMAWAEVKASANTVKAADLTVGQMIRIQYGREGNFVVCTVSAVSKELFLGKFCVVKAISKNHGSEIEFCSMPEDLIEKAA